MMHASFFFVDIVGLSNPLLSTVTQASKIRILNDSLAQCETYENTPDDEKIVFPTGDGMWIAFLSGGLEKPIKLAREIHKKLQNYNSEKTSNENIQIRIGCHSGDVFFVNDLNGNVNLWGSGIIMARRVMDAGDAGHILITSAMAERLLELSDNYKKIIHPIHDFKIKHGEVLLVYSVYNDSFGNSNRPERGIVTSKLGKKNFQEEDQVKHNELKLTLILTDPKTNHFKISREFIFENKSDEPIYEIYDTIKTDIKKSFVDLDWKAYDENENSLVLGGIHLDTGFKKKISVKLNKPVFRGDKNKEITMHYETELPSKFLEEFFHTKIDNLSVNFVFSPNSGISNPRLYLLTNHERTKVLEKEGRIKNDINTKITWDKIRIGEKDIMRLEW